ncbi:MAG: DNRLRE domain-containing protein [Candidatus Binatia bacterium]
MSRKLTLALLPCAVLIGVAVQAPAAVTLTAVADTYVDRKDDMTNFGGSATSSVGREMGGMGAIVTRGLLEFDLSDIPEGATIGGATLRVFVASTSADPLGLEVVASLLAAPFDEFTVTWNNQPGALPAPTSSAAMNAAVGEWFAIDVTELVRAARAGATPGDLFLRLAAANETTNDDEHFRYRTRETGTATAPQLVLSFAAVAPMMSPPIAGFAVLALAVLAVLALRRPARAARS